MIRKNSRILVTASNASDHKNEHKNMSRTMVLESRPLDSVYDGTYVNSSSVAQPPPAASSTSAAVSGVNRFAHHTHYRPRVPHISALLPPEVLLAPTQSNVDPSIPHVVDERTTTEAGMQTVMRESESQTDPYTPQFIVDSAKPTPEVSTPRFVLAVPHSS